MKAVMAGAASRTAAEQVGDLVKQIQEKVVQAQNPDADVAKLLAEDMGVTLNIVPVTGPNRIPYLLSNQVDILVASLGITPERAEQVDFSQPYAGIEIFVFGRARLDAGHIRHGNRSGGNDDPAFR